MANGCLGNPHDGNLKTVCFGKWSLNDVNIQLHSDRMDQLVRQLLVFDIYEGSAETDTHTYKHTHTRFKIHKYFCHSLELS